MSGRKQFDVDTAVDQSMITFWRRGYADTSMDMIGAVTGLGRGSLYGTFGGKNGLFLRAVDRYGEVYGARYDAALARHPADPVRAMSAFLDVVIDRIADPHVPDGCLVAMAATQLGTLEPDARTRVRRALDIQAERLRAALVARGVAGRAATDIALFVVAVSQSLSLLSCAGTELRELRSIARTAIGAVTQQIAPPTG
ncbi:MAG TPA: TetR/AcrR family transcriptional regulator [Pseudonocardia sp.]